MAQKKKELTDDEKFELALQAEQELARLARNYTILERNRAEFTADGLGGKLAKKRRVLNIFKKERHNILTDLRVASAKGKGKEDDKLTQQLMELLEDYDCYDGEIHMEKSNLKEIDEQIGMTKKKILEFAAQLISDEKYTQRILQAEKTLQTLENKLEVQIKKFCVICADNIRLREELNHLLYERRDFNKIWDKLIRNLSVGKKFMLDLIEQATIAYDQREEWVSKLQFLRTKAKNDLIAHIQEMRQLQRKRDNDSKLQEYFAVKGQKRVMRDLERRKYEKRQLKREKLQRKLTEYIQMMRDIKEFTGTSQVSEIAKNFLDQEEENFGVFNYINELNKEMEELSDSLGNLHIEIDRQRVLQEFRAEQQQNRLAELRNKLEYSTGVAEAKAAELEHADSVLGKVISGIQNLFQLFRCRNDPLIMLLGHNEHITYQNVILYLEILEKNIQESFVTVYTKEEVLVKSKKMKVDNMTVYVDLKSVKQSVEPVERICRTSPCPLCIEHDIVSDVIDLLQFAYSKEEIEEKLAQRLKLEGSRAALHNVSECHLPKSRQIIQKRFLEEFDSDLVNSVWFQNRRAKFRKQERLAQQKASNANSDSPNPQTNIKAETNGTTKSSVSNNKDVKPGSPHSSISTTPNSNTSSISSHNSSKEYGVDIKPVSNGKLSEDSLSNNNRWPSMSPQTCNTALLVQQANKVLSSQPPHLQSHHNSHAAVAAAAALSSPFTSLLGATGSAASYLLGDHLKPTAANHLF